MSQHVRAHHKYKLNIKISESTLGKRAYIICETTSISSSLNKSIHAHVPSAVSLAVSGVDTGSFLLC